VKDWISNAPVPICGGLPSHQPDIVGDRIVCARCGLDLTPVEEIDWRARAEKAEANQLSLERDNDILSAKLSVEEARANDLQAKLAAAEKRAEEFRGYVQHGPDCPLRLPFPEVHLACTCGLSSLLTPPCPSCDGLGSSTGSGELIVCHECNGTGLSSLLNPAKP